MSVLHEMIMTCKALRKQYQCHLNSLVIAVACFAAVVDCCNTAILEGQHRQRRVNVSCLANRRVVLQLGPRANSA